ncbi:hypothetical protein BB560_002105 [Smittium megazygosporum]|uniref:Uncharacterized protein n=1 Tax=Smittium megazygosporum TaxID=133381 RepID=A0A2T9Z0I7_9FUNG|nr:hypothetical protein BB560_005708 [Smittium megazygosporum]PVV03411.1 hypothetical protein BB560_002105 [Smittium megazygosporum]
MFKKKAKSKNIRKVVEESAEEQSEYTKIVKRGETNSKTKKHSISGFDDEKILNKTLGKSNLKSSSAPKDENEGTLNQQAIPPPEIPFNSLSINPFSTSGIPSAADIQLAKLKRAELSSKTQTFSSKSDYISLESPAKIAAIRRSNLYDDSMDIDPEYEEENSEHISSIDYEQYRLKKITTSITDVDEFGIDNIQIDSFKDDRDEDPVFVTDDTLKGVDENQIMQAIHDNQSLGTLKSQMEVESDSENLSWELERLKNSGVDPRLYSQKAFVSPLGSRSPYQEDSTQLKTDVSSNKKPKDQAQIPAPETFLNFLKQICNKQSKLLAEKKSNVENLDLSIKKSQDNVVRLNSELEQVQEYLEKFSNIRDQLKNNKDTQHLFL